MQTDNLAYAIDPALSARHEAERRAMETLLNCYCREVAWPQGQMRTGQPFGQDDWPQSVHMALGAARGSAMHVQLPHSETRLLAVVAAPSVTGNYRYLSSFYCKAPGRPWQLLDATDLAGVLLRELALQTGTPHNAELMAQIGDSVEVTAALIQAARPAPFPADPLAAFIASEQSLVFGHPFHPAPKSRQGVAHDDMLRYAPEAGARFPLHYFAVPRDYLVQQSVLDSPCDALVAAQAPAGLAPDAGHALIPVHPWQARYLLGHPAVARALREGRLRDLGAQGAHYIPTSSIRTLFNPDNPYFYKGSLNIRITNCVRKNAIYELEGALQVTRIMRALMPALAERFPGACVLEEPAFMSVDLQLGDSQLDKEVTEGFGLILRRAFGGLLGDGVRPLLAGALFGNHVHGEQRLAELIAPGAAEQWFGRYVEQVMYPVLHCYFAHGVVFEPHLQNIVVGIGDDGPAQVFLRDFEGVKLVRERHGEAALAQVSSRAREALWYSGELGWKRVAYCLFVNNFCEAVNRIGAHDAALRARLWGIVRAHLERYQALHGDAASAERIGALLAGQALPGKTNLLNRFFKRADRATTYQPIGNPWAEGGA